MSDPDASAQAADVNKILRDLDIDTEDADHVVEVWNKVDRLDEAGRDVLRSAAETHAAGQGVFLVSALTGEGLPALLTDIEARIAGQLGAITITVPADGLALLPWLYENANVRSRTDLEDGAVELVSEMTTQALDDLRRQTERYPGLKLV
jgi:GTP-binding protein HflX